MKRRILRWLLALGAWAFCVSEVRTVFEIGGGIPGIPSMLFAFAALFAGLLLVFPEIIRPVCEFIGDRLVDVIFPGAHASKPPLSYLLARRYRDQRRFADAIAEYEKIIRYYPNEKTAFLELIALAREAGDERIFRKYTRRYERRFGQLPVPT